MPILNYTTEVTLDKCITKIQHTLCKRKAQAIMFEFDNVGIPSAISFRIQTQFGMITYRMPANVDKVQSVLKQQRVAKRFTERAHAARVAWKIILNWLEAQCAFIETEMVTIDQVFLSYAQDQKTGQTVYERLTGEKFVGLALPAPTPQ